ncbi:MAG TPA: D-glycerate dehydrogenase [bacterium]|nr:D-glycerate dehydrogenase [bacterium]
MKRILVTADLPGRMLKEISEKGDFAIKILSDIERENIKKAVSDFSPHGMVTLLSDRIGADIIDLAPDLAVISNYAAGYNNIDIKYCSKKNVAVTNTPDVLTDSTADIAIMLLLMASRRAVESEKFTRSGLFKGWKPDLFLGRSLAGKTLGILGLGRIGFATAVRARAFGMNIIYWGRKKASDKKERSIGAEYCGFEELIKSSDFISLHLPFVSDLHHLIGSKEISMMKKDAVIINTSRGQLIDEQALAEALHEKRIFAAGLDVYEKEPEIFSSLFRLDNVVLLPHIGSATEETRAEMAELALSNCIDVLNGKMPSNKVN